MARTAAELTAALAVLLCIFSSSPASAHDGQVVFFGDIGPYFVEAVDEVVTGVGLLYTITLRDQSTGLPVDDAEVIIAAQNEESAFGPATANRFANAYQVLIPDQGAAEWTVTVRIARSATPTTSFEHDLAGVGAHIDSPWWTSKPVLLIAWTLPVIGAVVVLRSWRRG